MERFLIYAVLLMVSGCHSSPAFSGGECSREMAMQAEEAVDGLKSWHDVYAGYKKYAVCDDGAIAEGFTDVIVRLLVDRPIDFKPLVDDKAFETFMLNHIGELMTQEDFQSLKAKAQTCAALHKSFCENLALKLL